MTSFGIIGGGRYGPAHQDGFGVSGYTGRRTKRVPGDISSKTSAGRMGGKNFHSTGTPSQPISGRPDTGSTDRANFGARNNSPLTMRGGSGHMKASHKSFGNGKGNNRGRGRGGSGGGGNRNNYVSYHGETTGRSPGKAGTFESKISATEISLAQKPQVGSVMGNGAHLQVLDLPAQTYADSRFYVKNVTVTPTGINKPASEVSKYFTNYVYPAYINLLQTSVNYKVSVPVAQFQQWFFNIQSALHLWFHINKILTAYDNQPTLNRGINHLREQLTAEDLNLYDNLTKLLETKVMDPKMVSFIRWMHDLYTTSATNPNAELIQFSYEAIILEDTMTNALNQAIINMSNVDLIKVNSLMLKARSNWTISLSNYDGVPKYDEKFYTFWANTPEHYESENKEYIKPYVPDEVSNYNDNAHYNLFGNEYSPLLHGLTCLHKSVNGQVGEPSEEQGIYYGFVTPDSFNKDLPSSYVRFDSQLEKFVPAGFETTVQNRITALIASPSAATMQWTVDGNNNYVVIDNWPYSALKPQCQEPISMSIATARQDFNIGMRDLFSWSTLIRSDA